MDGRKVISIILPGAPRTKKTSNNAFVSKSGKPIVLPSEEFEAWLKYVLSFRPIIQQQLREMGVDLPVRYRVGIEARIYRKQDSGDATGFYQAIGDAIQEATFQCQQCRKVVYACSAKEHSSVCPGALKRKRAGLGIVLDDKLIEHWDRSRRLIDRENPRVELDITPFEGEQMTLGETPE